MLFNSVQFLFFFPVVFLSYFFCTHIIKKNTITQAVLLAFSLFFYGCWKPEYLILIIISVVITYYSGILMEKSQKYKGIILTASLVSNFAILFFFKYYNFLGETLNFLSGAKEGENVIPHLNILLPVGISFYTFQALGYSIDVYKGKVSAEKNFMTYALFVTFFPQLVAGPIERTGNLLPQFKADHYFNYKRVTDGLKLAAWGFFEKIVIADRLAIYVDAVYNNVNSGTTTGCSLALASVLFSFQVLCDFAGYSDIAIGVAKVLGFNLMRNFQRPFFAKSIAEVWTRWHISLSTWFKDYLYFPLGGSRVKQWRHCLNLIIVMVVSGFWHGAAWHYIAWGAMHGIFQVAGILTTPFRRKMLVACHLGSFDQSVKGGLRIKRGWQIVKILITFALFAFAASVFRANNMFELGIVMKKFAMIPVEILNFFQAFKAEGFGTALKDLLVLHESISGYGVKHCLASLGFILLLLFVDYITRTKRGVEILAEKPWYIRWACYYAVVFAIIFLSVTGKTQFVYFQF